MLPRKLQELWDGMERNYEWPCLIVLGHERQHHLQIEAILRKIKG